MAANGRGGKDINDFYGVLGLNKGCTDSDLRNAYKNLALKWHPDRCSASGNAKWVEEAKKKFQAIQQAYSVLSDSNLRLLYDFGVYDSGDDVKGMGKFMDELATLMTETKLNENEGENLQELQRLLDEMWQANIVSAGSTSHTSAAYSTSSAYGTYTEGSNSNKCNSTEMNSGKAESTFGLDSDYQNFCLGVEGKGGTGENRGGRGSGRRRSGSKQK